MKPDFFDWLDRYVDVDLMKIRPAVVIPRMRWWEWVWYVTVIVAFALLLDRLDDWINHWLADVPVLDWVPWLVTWPVIGVLSLLFSRFLLPARKARAAAPGEGWLMAGIWMAVLLIQYLLPGIPWFSW